MYGFMCLWGQRLLTSVPQLLSTLHFEAKALTEPGSHQLVRLTDQHTPETLLSVFLIPSPELGLRALPPCSDFYMGTEDLKSKYVPGSSLAQPSPQTSPLDPGNSF